MAKTRHINSEAIPVGAEAAGAPALRALIYGVTLSWAALFVVLGVRFDLQWYADGSIFTYAILVQDAWEFHWHNISGRAFVYLYAHVPAEIYVALTGHAAGAQIVYATLFFSAPLLGLGATYAADATPGRIIFLFACVSTALVLPLVFGFPTEMWIAHAVFWPALALAHAEPRSARDRLLLTLATTALVMSHAGGTLLAVGLPITLAPRGWRDRSLRHSLEALAVALAIFVGFLLAFPPDDYIAFALQGAARNFLRPDNFAHVILRVLAAGVIVYALAAALLRRLGRRHAFAEALVPAGLVLGAYWLRFDTSLHAEMRYPLRAGLLLFPSLLGGAAALLALQQAHAIAPPLEVLARLARALRRVPPAFLAGAFTVATLVHVVETAKFTSAWRAYVGAVRDLAMGEATDPDLGDPRFVSAARLGEERNLLSWGSTTHFLSVLVAPQLLPRRLVVDPDTNYFYISCATATRSLERTGVVVPATSRALIRTYACLYR